MAADYRYCAVAGRMGIAAVEARGHPIGTVARAPDSGMGQLHPGTLAGATRPPISRTRLGMAPDDKMMIVPIKIMVEPQAHRKADAKGDERAAKWPLVINHVRRIYRHVEHLGVGRDDFDGAIVGNDILLRGGLQIPESLGLGTEPLNGIQIGRASCRERV